MRALYFPELSDAHELVIQGPQFHHLVNVTRAKVGEKLLLLDGNGNQANCALTDISKNSAIVKVEESSFYPRPFELSLALCIPKRDALDLSLKQAVEIGIKHIYLVESDFCVNNQLKDDRIDRLIESAMEQANNPYLVTYSKLKGLENLPFSDFNKVFCLTSQEEPNLKPFIWENEKLMMIIGPEGGFSQNENTLLDEVANLQKLKLKTQILRTPTAISVASGHLLAMCKSY